MFANVINAWEEAYEAQRNEPFCRDYHLNERVLLDVYNIKIQLKAKLMECQIMVKDEDYYNQNAKNVELLKGVVLIFCLEKNLNHFLEFASKFFLAMLKNYGQYFDLFFSRCHCDGFVPLCETNTALSKERILFSNRFRRG